MPRPTDGVFRGLTDGRLPTPWIEAFRKQQEQQKQQQDKQRTAAREARPQERDLSPRRMSDSYHRVVLPLGQDPWLSDTYINSSGHIRFVHAVARGPPPRRRLFLAPRPSNVPTLRLGTIFMDLDARKLSRDTYYVLAW